MSFGTFNPALASNTGNTKFDMSVCAPFISLIPSLTSLVIEICQLCGIPHNRLKFNGAKKNTKKV